MVTRRKALRARAAAPEPTVAELQGVTAQAFADRERAEAAEDENGLLPGEARTRGQIPALDERVKMEAHREDDEPEPETVVMTRDGLEMEVEAANVEAHRRQGFVVRENAE